MKSEFKRVSFAQTPKLKSRSPQIIHSGLTYTELLLVIAIIAVLGAATSPFISRFILQSNLESGVDRVVSTIRKAQNYAMDGKNNEAWGVCLIEGDVRLFSGSCSAPTFSEDFDIPASVSISAFTETTFSKLRGEPSNVLDIKITTNIEERSVRVNKAGGMEID